MDHASADAAAGNYVGHADVKACLATRGTNQKLSGDKFENVVELLGETTANPRATLSPEFLVKIAADGFQEVGIFGLDESGRMFCRLDALELSNTNFAIYAFVGFSDGGTVLRIGESCERPVAKRIFEYPRYINDACNGKLGSNGYFAGGTKPWERDGWFDYLRKFQTGLIFVKVTDFAGIYCLPKDVLHSNQNALIAKYAPPFCNDSLGSRPLRQAWEALHGKAQKHFKRARSPV